MLISRPSICSIQAIGRSPARLGNDHLGSNWRIRNIVRISFSLAAPVLSAIPNDDPGLGRHGQVFFSILEPLRDDVQLAIHGTSASRATAVMPYEVMAVRPGISVVLRRLGAQEEIEVREKSASRTLKRWDMLVARLNPVGPTGGPEIEMGAMLMPSMVREEIAEAVHQERDRRPDGGDGVRRCKGFVPIFHQIWLETIVAPQFPMTQTAEGDPLVFVTMQFDVLDEQRARSALNAEPSLECEHDIWHWVVDDLQLGTIQLAGSQLTFETHSEPRADRGRQLLERIAQDAIAYRSCDRVDLNEEAQKAIRSGKRPEAPPDAEDGIPPEVKDQLFQEFMAKHNQHWLDDQIPALDQQTPRFAAQSSTLQPRLVGLIKGMENDYLRALADGELAFDPTWMWDELGLSDQG